MLTTPTTTLAGSSTTARPGLVDADWLEAHLDDPAVVVVEVDVSPAAHEAGHIPGAVLWDIYTDLKDGDYQLRSLPSMQELVRRSGIHADTTVVFYGYGPAIGVWLMRWCGHTAVALLDLGARHLARPGPALDHRADGSDSVRLPTRARRRSRARRLVGGARRH